MTNKAGGFPPLRILQSAESVACYMFTPAGLPLWPVLMLVFMDMVDQLVKSRKYPWMLLSSFQAFCLASGALAQMLFC